MPIAPTWRWPSGGALAAAPRAAAVRAGRLSTNTTARALATRCYHSRAVRSARPAASSDDAYGWWGTRRPARGGSMYCAATMIARRCPLIRARRGAHELPPQRRSLSTRCASIPRGRFCCSRGSRSRSPVLTLRAGQVLERLVPPVPRRDASSSCKLVRARRAGLNPPRRRRRVVDWVLSSPSARARRHPVLFL